MPNSLNGISLNHMVLLDELIILLTHGIAPSLNDKYTLLPRTSCRRGKFVRLLQIQPHFTQVVIDSDRCQQREFYALDPFPHPTPTAVLPSSTRYNWKDVHIRYCLRYSPTSWIPSRSPFWISFSTRGCTVRHPSSHDHSNSLFRFFPLLSPELRMWKFVNLTSLVSHNSRYLLPKQRTSS
jgi:hypothetical protein